MLEAQDVAGLDRGLHDDRRGRSGARSRTACRGRGAAPSGWLLAAGVALVLGFGLALTLDRSDTRVRTRRSAEEHFGLPVIAEVVKFPFWSRVGARWSVVRQPDTAVAESYRTLRSALMLLGPIPDAQRTLGRPRPPRSNGERSGVRGDVIMITSAGSGDGKTTTVANLAAAYGESGYSVLVLSFDLQRVR